MVYSHAVNILFISEVSLPTVSGVASSTDSITRFMAGRGHHVYLVCPKPVVAYTAPPQKNLTLTYTTSLRDPFFVGKPMGIIPFGFFDLKRILATKKIDVVHIQEPGSLGIMALFLSKIYRVPTVGAMHFSLEQIFRVVPAAFQPFTVPFMKWYIRFIYPRYTAIMMPTKTVIPSLSAIIGNKERIHAVSNGVDTAVFTPRTGSYASLRRKYHLDLSAIYFSYIGRLDSDKNIETILRALPHTDASIRLILAGVGKQVDALHVLARTLGVSDRIAWFGRVDRPEMVDLYRLSDGFVIMSPVETQSLVALQAIACGLPLLAADAGALPELVRQGKNGFLISTFDENGLAEKMTYLAGNKPARENMGKESRRLSLRQDRAVALGGLERLYRRLCR